VVFHHDERRSSAVAQELVGEEFAGVVGCDFFSAYNPLSGRKRVPSKLKERDEEGAISISAPKVMGAGAACSAGVVCPALGGGFAALTARLAGR